MQISKRQALFATLLVCSAASAEDFSKCVTIETGGGDVGGGENLDCGKGPPFLQSLVQGTVKCADASLRIPAGYTILGPPKVTIDAKQKRGGAWAAVRRGPDMEPQSDGSTLITVSGKNWSGNWTREMCLIVSAERAPTPGRTR
jgi:hypothetical protein